MALLDRFLKYVDIDTTSDSSKCNNPTSSGQIYLAEELYEELKELNIDDVYVDEKNCYIYALLKGDKSIPSIGFVAHIDTSEDAPGKNIKPRIITEYDGKDIKLNDNVSLKVQENPDLKMFVGKTLITTDGTTLLGADDKAGIAEIMEMLEYFSKNECKHGDIFVCFTPDEEIGLGTQNLDFKHFQPDVAYTVDGSMLGELSYENFNAATANIDIKGVNYHPGLAKGRMINAIRLASLINELLPDEIPENTDGYDGFYHLKEINGDITNASMKYIIRDFDRKHFEERKQIVNTIVDKLNEKYGDVIFLDIKDTYYNMLDVIKDKSIIDITKEAMNDIGIVPIITPVRGGTDGANISYSGIPCPDIGAGGHNFHSIYEYVCLEDMEQIRDLLISIVNTYAKDKNKELIKK